MNVEYKAKITGDMSGLEKVLKAANGSMKQLTDKDFIIKLNYDGNVKALNKTLSDAVKACPELAIQFQYDVNKKALEQKFNEIKNLETLQADIDTGKVQRKIREMVSEIETGFNSQLIPDDELKKKIEELYKYANSAAKAGENVAINFEQFEDIDQSFDGLLTKLSKTPQYFGDMSKGISGALEQTKSDISEIQKQLDFFKSKGAVDMTEGFDKTEEEIDDASKKLKELVDGFEAYYKKKKGLNAGNYWKQLKQQIDNGDESLKELLSDLKLLDDGKLNLITAGNKNQGGIIGAERVAIARKNENNQYEDTLALKRALDEAYDAGVNVARIMDVIGDESRETFVEIQERATGKMLGAYGVHTESGLPEVNPDFLEATDEQIQKLIKDIFTLQKLGINAEAHPENLIYDKLKGFQFIDLDLKPASYINSAEMIEDAAIRIAGDVEDMYDELGDAKGLKAVQNFGDKFRNIGAAMAEVVDAAEKATEEAQDSHSPYKVAEKLGEKWSVGYAEGIKKHKADVEDAVRELVKAGELTMRDLVEDLPNIVGNAEYVDLENPVKNILANGKESTVSPTQTFDNEIQKNLTYLENYKNTIKEIDRLKLEPETEETRKKLEELNTLADYFASHITVIRSENQGEVDRSMMRFGYDWNENLRRNYTEEQRKAFYEIAGEKTGLRTNQEVPQFHYIKDELKSIESQSEKTRQSLNETLANSASYVKHLKSDFLDLIDTKLELKVETNKRDIELYEKDIANILKKYPELEQFGDKFTSFGAAKKFAQSDEWNDFLATLPQARAYLESIGYSFESVSEAERNVGDSSAEASQSVGKAEDSIEEESQAAKEATKNKEDLADAEREVANESEHVADVVGELPRAFEETTGETSRIESMADAERELAGAIEEVGENAKESAEDISKMGDPAAVRENGLEQAAVDAQNKYRESIKATSESLREQRNLEQAQTVNNQQSAARSANISSVRDLAMQQEISDAQKKYKASIQATTNAIIEQTNAERNLEQYARRIPMTSEEAFQQLGNELSETNVKTKELEASLKKAIDTSKKADSAGSSLGLLNSLRQEANKTGTDMNKEAAAAYNKLKASAKDYYNYLRKEAAGALTETERKKLERLKKEWDDATAAVGKYKTVAGSKSSIEKLATARSNFNESDDVIAIKYSQKLSDNEKKLRNLAESGKYTSQLTAQLEKVADRIQEINSEPIDLKADGTIEKLGEIDKQITQAFDAAKIADFRKAHESSIAKLNLQIEEFMQKNSKMGAEFKSQFENLKLDWDTEHTNKELEELVAKFAKLKSEVTAAGKTGASFLDTIRERLVGVNAQLIAQYLSLQDIIRYVRTLAQNVVGIDTALTELRKVSDASTGRLEQSFRKSSETALELGQSIEHVINVTADWSRLGYNVDEAEELARVTTLFTSVGDNMSSEDASSYLISTMQGFQIAADQAEDIVDKYNKVANNFAIDTAGIGEALQRSAASFNSANTDLSKSIALITATNEVVQNPESVGTLWKTMSARIRGAKTELEELGEEEDDFTQTTSKLRDLVKGLTDFDIMKDEENFKDIYEIIIGIGEKWDELTDIERASLGEALAGKRNANALFAVLGNLDTLQDAYAAAEDSAESAAREQENYMKSIQYSLDRWQASVEKISVDLLNSDFLKGLVESGVDLLGVLDAIVSKTNGLTSILAGIGAGAGFMKVGGIDAISSSLVEVQNNYSALSASIEKYNAVAAKAAASGKANIAQFVKADSVMGDYIRSLNGASGSMKGYIGYLISAKLKTVALNVATTALNTAITMGISLAITGLVSWISKLITAEAEARQAAVDLAETYEQESESLDTQIEQYKKLYEQLDKARAKGEDTYAIKEQLAALQEELNKKYGDEFEKLNLVNGAYTDQISILKELSKEKAKDYLATNADQFDKAFDYLDKQRTYNLGELTLNEDTRGLLPILEKYGIDTNTDGTMFLPVQLKANIEDADEAMTALYADIKDYEKTHDVDLSFITDAISGQKQDIDADEKFEQYKKLRESYIDATIASDEAMAAQYEKGLEAVQAYNDALDSGENVEKAKANLEAIQNEINNTSFDNEGIRNRFLSIFDGIDEELEKRSVIDNAFDVEGNKFIEYAEKLRGLTDIDLYNLDDSQLKGAFNYLLHSFGLTTENAGLLIDKLVELGIVQRDVARSSKEMADAENSWSSERDAALDKLGLRKETSNGVEYDESWSKYLETIKQLNPELANNEEELEKCALANMQFSHAVDDLSKNFETYKAALQDANALTPEYSNAINALADDLTYLTGINFSISEASDFLADANNLELLEKAINGSDEALQQLQQHASQSIRIKIDTQSLTELRTITTRALQNVKDELTELSKGGNVDLTLRPKIDTQLLRDVGWDKVEEVAGEYATVFTKTFSNEAGDVAVNFTPIIVDENGNYVDVMEPDALTEYAEAVIAGTQDDYLKLQIGAEFTGEDAIDQAEAAAMRIHNLHELQIELGLDTTEFNSQFTGLVDWLETADLGTLEAQTYINEDPFIQALIHLANESEEMAAKIKQIFAELGWEIKWDTKKMKVPTSQQWSGLKGDTVHVSSIYGQNGAQQVNWKYEEMDVPTNIRFERTGGTAGRRSSTSGYTPRSMSPSQKSGAASNLGGGSSGGGGGGGSDTQDKEDDYKETVDFFERLIKVLDQQIDLLDAHLQDVVGSFAKNMILDAEEDAIKKKMAGYSSAIEMYSAKASEALSKIPGEVAEKLQNGAVAIDEFVGESNKDVVDAISDYEGWADKVAECKQQIVELREALRQLELQKFQNIAQDFQELFDVRNTQIDLIGKAISLFETDRGKVVGRGFYDKQIEQTEKQLTDLYAKHTALSDQMTKAIANGVNITAPCYSNVA